MSSVALRRASDGPHPGALSVGQAARAWSWLAIVAILGVLLPAALVAAVPNVSRSEAWVVGLAIMAWSSVHLSTSMVRGTPRLFHFFFWLFTYIFFGLAATCQLRSGDIPWTTLDIARSLDLPTMGVIALGLLCFDLGTGLGELRSRPAGAVSADAGRIHRLRAIAMTTVGLALALLYLVRVGVSKAWVSRDEGAALQEAVFPDPTTLAIWTALATFPLLIGVGCLAHFARTERNRVVRVLYLMMASVGAIIELMINSPTSSARYTFGTVAFALLIYTGVASSRLRTRLILVGTVFSFLFLFPLANAFRSAGGSHERTSFFAEYQGNPDYDAYWMVANAVDFWHQERIEPFRQLMGSVFFWVPRTMWADKPYDTAVVLANFRGYDFTNISAPLWAEALVNGGLVFLVVTFFLLGWGLRHLDGQFERTYRQGGWWILLMGVFPVYLNILLRGSLLQATGSLAVALACCLFVSRGGRTTRAIPSTIE